MPDHISSLLYLSPQPPSRLSSMLSSSVGSTSFSRGTSSLLTSMRSQLSLVTFFGSFPAKNQTKTGWDEQVKLDLETFLHTIANQLTNREISFGVIIRRETWLAFVIVSCLECLCARFSSLDWDSAVVYQKARELWIGHEMGRPGRVQFRLACCIIMQPSRQSGILGNSWSTVKG